MLEERKKTDAPKEIEIGTVYKDYKTIPIQKLEPKKLHQKEPLKGETLWKKKDLDILYY